MKSFTTLSKNESLSDSIAVLVIAFAVVVALTFLLGAVMAVLFNAFIAPYFFEAQPPISWQQGVGFVIFLLFMRFLLKTPTKKG